MDRQIQDGIAEISGAFVGALFACVALLCASVAYACEPDVTVDLMGTSRLAKCGEAIFVAEGSPKGGSYSWSCGQGSLSDPPDPPQDPNKAERLFTATGSGTGYVEVTYEYDGRTSDPKKIYVTIVEIDAIDPNDQAFIAVGDSRTFTATAIPHYPSMIEWELSGPLSEQGSGDGWIFVRGNEPTEDGEVTATVCGDANDCDCPEESVPVSVVELDPNGPFAVSGATLSEWDPNHHVACWTSDPYDPCDANTYVEIEAKLSSGITAEEEQRFNVISWDGGVDHPDDPRKRHVRKDIAAKTRVTANVGSDPNYTITASVDVLVVKVNSITVEDADNSSLSRTNPPDANDLYLPERWAVVHPGAMVNLSASVSPSEGADYLVATVDGAGAVPSEASFGGQTTIGPGYLWTHTGNRDFTVNVGVQKDGSARAGGSVSIDCGQQSVNVHVCTVVSVTWERYETNAPLTDNDHPSFPGGKRIFPGKLDPDDLLASERKKVRIRAQIEPAAPGMQVYLGILDIDDPYSDPNIDPINPTSGPDNYDSDYATYVNGITDAAGVVTPLPVFEVGYSPGDNFRAAGSLSSAALVQLTHEQIELSL